MPATNCRSGRRRPYRMAMNSPTGRSVMNRIFRTALGHFLAEVPQAVGHFGGARHPGSARSR